MSESVGLPDPNELLSLEYIREKAYNPDHPTGFPPKEVVFRGVRIIIHDTNNLFKTLAGYLRLHPNGDEDPDKKNSFSSLKDYSDKGLLDTYGLGKAFETVRLNNPLLFDLAKTLVQDQEEHVLKRLAARDSEDPTKLDDALSDWQVWYQENIASHKQDIVMSMLYEELVPVVDEMEKTIEHAEGPSDELTTSRVRLTAAYLCS